MPTEVDVQARVIAGDGHQRPAGEEKEAEGARAAPARQKSAASAEWARRLEAEGDLQDRSVARSTAFAIGQRYFHGTVRVTTETKGGVRVARGISPTRASPPTRPSRAALCRAPPPPPRAPGLRSCGRFVHGRDASVMHT